MKRPGGSGLCLEIEGRGLVFEAPADLRLRFLYTPAAITWNGCRLNGEDSLALWARHHLEGVEFQIEGALQGSRPGLFIRVDGLTYQLAECFVLPGATVVLDGPWQTSLSYQAIRGDKRRQKLREKATDLLLEKAAEVALYSPLESDRIEFVRAFIETIESDKLRELLSFTSPDVL